MSPADVGAARAVRGERGVGEQPLAQPGRLCAQRLGGAAGHGPGDGAEGRAAARVGGG
ncbi:hypothetical protein [Streptomyces aurantiacus]|uniref:hypothetical protein n=1 Tax=Streptomyces aurantiacus TaxID=47760 RepID=UPI001319CEF3|nr:hypothetical protein [Streptomyces aurantiacus]